MSHDTFDEQAAAYALDALDAGEHAAFEAHLAAGCARCESTLRASREALAAVALEGPAAVPPPEVRAQLMRRVAGRTDARGRTDVRRLWLRWALATAAAMVVGGFLTGMFVAARYEAELGRVARETSRLREDLNRHEAALQTRVTAYQAVVELLRDPATRVITMKGAGPSPTAEGRVVWNETSLGGQVLVAKLPPAPEGKAYEMWTIAGGQPTAAGVFQVDASGQAIHRLPPGSGRVDVFAITLEPAAGVPAPTGPIVLASTK